MQPHKEIVDTIPVFFFIWDIQRRETIFISDRFFHEYLDDYYHVELPSKDLREYISPESQPDYDTFFENLSPENQYRECVALKAADSLENIEWLSLQTYPVLEEGEVKRIVGHFKDVTHIQEETQLLDDQVQSLDAISFLLAHELSAPVSNIMGLTDFLKHTVQEENVGEHLHLFDTVYNFGGEILTLARGLVSLINLQAVKTNQVKKKSFPLRHFLESGLEEFYFRHQKSQINIEYELSENLEIHADHRKLKWAIDELMLYLLKVSKKKADIYISSPSDDKGQDDLICIYAENLDLPKEEIQKVLKKSNRLKLTDVTGKKLSGMLELVIANEIVQLQGGKLSLYEKDSIQGISIRLPKPQ